MVDGADLERLCGATHRGFESLPLSHNIIYFPKAIIYQLSIFFAEVLQVTLHKLDKR